MKYDAQDKDEIEQGLLNYNQMPHDSHLNAPSNMSETSLTSSNESKEIQHKLAHERRGESRLKWWILFDVFFSWTSAYFLTFCVSSLETTLLDLFDWDSSYFSYIVASTFFGAIIGPFLLPFFDGLKNRFTICSLLNNQIILFIGQLAFGLLLDLYHKNQESYLFGLICFSRFIIGIGMGSTDALAQSTINYWFGASESINEAFGILVIGIEIGTLTSRLAFPPFYHLFNDDNDNSAIALPFLLALFLPLISIVINIFLKIKLKKSRRIFPEYFVEDDIPNDNDSVLNESVSTVKQICNLSLTVWLVIFIVVFVNVVINVLYSCFVDPLHEEFKFSEYEADMVLSLTGGSIILFAFPAAFLMDYFGGPNYWLIMVSLVMTLSMGLLAGTALIETEDENEKNMNMYGILSITGFSILLPFAIVIFTLQAMVSPPQYAELIASISTTLWWTLSIIITNLFGWVHDSIGNYAYSILSVFVICSLTFIIAILLFCIDKRKNGPLTQCNQRNKDKDENVQPLLLNAPN